MRTAAATRASGPDWDALYALAQAQSGYFTTGQAASAGYSPPLLHKYLASGKVARVRRGIYRLVHFPAGEHEDLVTLWLWADQAKLHALTMPRVRPNTRVRDLPDIALLAMTGPIEGAELRLALERTFGFRATHPLPASVPDPPAFWEGPYAAMVSGDELIWWTLAEVTRAVSAFLDPSLDSADCGTWEPKDWFWRRN